VLRHADEDQGSKATAFFRLGGGGFHISQSVGIVKNTVALEVERLSVRFGATEVFTNLNFQLARGSSLAVIGPNGAGKTVLFRALIGVQPYTGIVRWAPGTKIGYVPQKLDIERDLPITANDFLRARTSVAHASKDEPLRVLARVGLEPSLLDQPIGSMSGGQFQRLMVAFALIGHPDALLLDEPAAGMDAPGQAQLNETLRSLQTDDGVTILFISHDLSVVYGYASQVLCLRRGDCWIGAPEEVLTPARLKEIYGTPIAFHIHDSHGN
jgi:zinc transport system ATP-binding protein